MNTPVNTKRNVKENRSIHIMGDMQILCLPVSNCIYRINYALLYCLLDRQHQKIVVRLFVRRTAWTHRSYSAGWNDNITFECRVAVHITMASNDMPGKMCSHFLSLHQDGFWILVCQCCSPTKLWSLEGKHYAESRISVALQHRRKAIIIKLCMYGEGWLNCTRAWRGIGIREARVISDGLTSVDGKHWHPETPWRKCWFV